MQEDERWFVSALLSWGGWTT